MNTCNIHWLTCVLAAGLVSCAHSGDPQVLQYRGALQPVRGGDTCVAVDAARLITHGILDLSVAKSYRIFPALQSMMVPLSTISGVNPGTSDTNTITLSSLQVSVSSGMSSTTPFISQKSGAGAGATPTSTWTVPLSGTIVAGGVLITAGDLVPEKALVGSKMVPIGEDWRSRFSKAAGAKDFSKAEILLSFQFVGTTLTGDNVITDVATLPLTVCFGCLLTPATPVASAGEFYAGCAGAVPAGYAIPCVPGQEDVVDCRYYCHQCQQSAALASTSTLPYEKCNTTTFCKP